MSATHNPLPETPWHMTFLERSETDSARHRNRCLYFRKSDQNCYCSMSPHFQIACYGSSRCEYYSEKTIRENSFKNFPDDKIQTLPSVTKVQSVDIDIGDIVMLETARDKSILVYIYAYADGRYRDWMVKQRDINRNEYPCSTYNYAKYVILYNCEGYVNEANVKYKLSSVPEKEQQLIKQGYHEYTVAQGIQAVKSSDIEENQSSVRLGKFKSAAESAMQQYDKLLSLIEDMSTNSAYEYTDDAVNQMFNYMSGKINELYSKYELKGKLPQFKFNK